MTTLPAVTHETLPSGKHRYRQDGEIHTGKSGRVYTAASAYEVIVKGWNQEVGQVIVFLHARPDLAAKGSPDANRITNHGSWRRIPGVIEITERNA